MAPWPAPTDLKNRRLHLLVLIVFVGMTASVMFHFVAGSVLHWNHVSSSFLLGMGGPLDNLGNTFTDLTGPLRAARASFGYVRSPWLAPTPLFHVVYIVLLPLGRAGAFLLQTGVFLAGLTLLLWRTYVDGLSSRLERVTYLLVLLLLSYPVLFVLERSNIEMLLFIIIAGFLYMYYVKRSAWCVVLLAIAISLKMYPAVFLVLLLADRRYRWTLYAALLSAFITLSSVVTLALVLPGSIVDFIRISVRALSDISGNYVVRFNGLPYGHSLWGLVVLTARLFGMDQGAFAARAEGVYTVAAFVMFAALAVFLIRFVELPWQRVALLTAAALALPSVSADYRLLYAYLPLAMLLNSAVRTRVDTVCIVLLGCLLVPMDYAYGVVLRSWGWPASHTSVSVVVYPLVMLTLAAVIIWDALAERGSFTRPLGLDQVGPEEPTNVGPVNVAEPPEAIAGFRRTGFFRTVSGTNLRSTWLRLLACILAVPLVWLSGPVASTLGLRLQRWPSLSPNLLSGFVRSAPEKPAELLQYAVTAAVIVAFLLVAFRQIEVIDGERRQLVVDRVSKKFGLAAVVCAAAVVSLLLCVSDHGLMPLLGQAAEYGIWLAAAVVLFIPARRRAPGDAVVDAPVQERIVHSDPHADVLAPATDPAVTHHRGRLDPASATGGSAKKGRLGAWILRLIMVAVVVVLAAGFLTALWPFLTGRLVVVNDYPNLQEYVRVPGAGDTFRSQSAFIAANSIGGLVPYEPLRDKGASPRLPASMAIKLKWDSRLLATFLLTHPAQTLYDAVRGAVVFIGDYSPSDVAALRRCLANPNDRRRFDAAVLAGRHRLRLIRTYSPAKSAFMDESSAVLKWQYQPGFFFHHHAAFLAPLTAIQNGEWLSRTPCAYGWLSTLLLALLLRLAGGLTFSRYLQVSYFFYVAYAVLFLVGIRYALRTWSARMLAVLVASGAFYMTGFWSLYLAPGFNPIRHLLDIVCLLVLMKAFSSRRLTAWTLLALGVAVLQIAVSREFGACLFAGVLTGTIAYAVWKPGRVRPRPLWLVGLAVGALVAAGIVYLMVPGTADSTSGYLLMGVSVGSASGRLIATLLVWLLCGCAIFGFSRGDDDTRFGFLMWMVYLAFLCVYYVWNPSPNHLWSLGPVIAMAFALALENVRSVSGRWMGRLLGVMALAAAVLYLVVPGQAVYVSQHASYERYVVSHRVFDWRLGPGDIRTTADPSLLAGDVALVRDSAPTERVFMISKYQDLLLYLAGKNSGFAWDDLMLSLVTKKEADAAVEAIRRARPAVLFVDRDVARSYSGDIVNSADPYIGWMQPDSLQRVALLENMSALFTRVRGDYRLAKSGDLIDVYVRR